VFCLAKDLRQELVFSGSWDMVIMIWNAEQQKFVGKVAQAHSDAVTQLLYTSINGCEYLISGSSDRSIALYRRKQSGSRDDLEVYKELGERTEKKHQDDQL
jgi:WD40 repeat protein